MTFEVTLLIFGILLLLVGLIGSVKAKELEVGTNSRVVRIVLTILGVALIIVSFNPDLVRDRTQSMNGSSQAEVDALSSDEVFSSMEEEPEIPAITSIENGFEGEFRIRLASSNNFLHLDGLEAGDKLLSIRAQENDDFTRFIFERDSDDTYRIKVKATGKYLHEDGLEAGDKYLSARYEESDDFTRFYVELNADNTVRLKVKGSNRYWHVDSDGDMLVSTRFQSEIEMTKFYLISK